MSHAGIQPLSEHRSIDLQEDTQDIFARILAQLAGKLQGEGLNLTFAFDTQIVEV